MDEMTCETAEWQSE